MESFSLISSSEAETQKIGREFGQHLRRGMVIALVGDLGAGKTQFVKGVASAMEIDPSIVSSPTFTIAHEYEGLLPIHHLDLYRLDGADEVRRSGVHEYLGGDGICLVEWPERAETLLPEHTILVRLQHLGGDRRQIDCFPPESE